MLKVNVGLSRKLSRDYNSTGFSLNLEGEVYVGPDNPEMLIERIKEYYDLAEEALNQQIERYESDTVIGSRDENLPVSTNGAKESAVPTLSVESTVSNGNQPSGSPQQSSQTQVPNGEAATNKQVQYLLNLGKRQGMTPPQLENRIENLLGRRIGIYDLTKREAGSVIDTLSQTGTSTAAGTDRTKSKR